ncbi:MAG: DMT family transporter, partial [Thermomicrobiales bacterium]
MAWWNFVHGQSPLSAAEKRDYVGRVSGKTGMSHAASTSAGGAESSSTTVLAQFVALALIWGASFLFIKVSLDGLSPVQVATGRLLLGAMVLISIMLVSRRQWPREPTLLMHLAIVSVPLCVGPFMLYAWAGQYLPSGLSSIYNAATPLMTMFIATVALPAERMTRLKLAGLLMGAAGVLIVLAPWHLIADTGALAGTGLAQLACLGATLCYGIAYTYTRRFIVGYHYDAISIAATELSVAAGIMLLITPFLGMQPMHFTSHIVISMLAMGIVGTGLAYVWNYAITKAWGATNAS